MHDINFIYPHRCLDSLHYRFDTRGTLPPGPVIDDGGPVRGLVDEESDDESASREDRPDECLPFFFPVSDFSNDKREIHKAENPLSDKGMRFDEFEYLGSDLVFSESGKISALDVHGDPAEKIVVVRMEPFSEGEAIVGRDALDHGVRHGNLKPRFGSAPSSLSSQGLEDLFGKTNASEFGESARLGENAKIPHRSFAEKGLQKLGSGWLEPNRVILKCPPGTRCYGLFHLKYLRRLRGRGSFRHQKKRSSANEVATMSTKKGRHEGIRGRTRWN